MTADKASCVYRGNTFYCTFEVTGTGRDAEVRIRYRDEQLTARTAGLSPLSVAEALLQEAVTLEAIAIKVAGSSPDGTLPPVRIDARERRAAA